MKEALKPGQSATDIAALIQGMEVSIDVSTGDHDAGHRLFGTVTLVQENQGGKHGLILLVQDPEPNFKAQPEQEPWCMKMNGCKTKCEDCPDEAAQPEQEPVAVSSAWSLREVYFDEDGEPSMHRSPPKRPWVGLTAQEAADCWTTSATKTWHNFEAALRSKNI